MAKWLEKTLGEVTAFIAKGIPPKYTEKENENTIRVLNQKCNRNFEISYSESRIHDCEKKKVPVDKMLRAGDVLINSTGTGTAGRVAQIVEVTVPTTIDGHMILMRPSEELDPIYYGYAVKSFQSQIEGLAEGSTGQTEINRRRLQDEVIIRYPSDKLVQKNIGSFLANIDEKIKTNKEINKNLHQQYMLIVDRFISQLDSYDIKPLSDVADCQNGRAFYKEGYDNEGAFVIDLGNVNTSGNFVFTNADKYISLDRYKQEKLERYRVLKNDLVMVMTDRKSTMDLLGKVGKIYKDGYYLLNQRMYRIRAKNGINVNYLYACLNSTETSNNLKEKALGSVQKYVNTGDICDLKIKIPPKDVMEKLSDILNPIFLQMENNILQNEILVEMRDILLPKLMSNEIDVSTLKI